MKIFIFIDSFPYFSETFIYNQFKELLIKKNDVKLIYLSSSNIDVNHSIIKLIRDSGKLKMLSRRISIDLFFNIIKFPYMSLLLFKYYSFKKAIFYIVNLKLLNEIDNSDVLHTHFGRVGEIAGKLYAAGILSKVKLVNSFHGADILPCKLKDYRLEYQNLFKFSSLLLVNSRYSRNLVNQINSSVLGKIIILPVGVDLELFSESLSKENKVPFRVVYAGRLVKFKGAINVLKIAKILFSRSYDIEFHIIGDGDDFSSLESYVLENRLDEIVVFHKALSHESVMKVFSISSIFLLPGITEDETGRAENQGLVIQEAQAIGLPVIVSNAGGMKEGLIDGETGFVVPEGDIDEFCKKILFFHNDRSKVVEFGNKGKEHVKKEFSNSILTEKLLTHYKSL